MGQAHYLPQHKYLEQWKFHREERTVQTIKTDLGSH